jgi:protein-tyrosine phosphatase
MPYPYQFNKEKTYLWGGMKQRKEFPHEKDYTIINVAHEDSYPSDHWIPLNDGVYDPRSGGHSFSDAVNTVRTEIQNGNNVFVHCAYGQSRSVIVLATALSAETDKSLEEILSTMEESSSHVDPEPSLKSKAEVYLRHT